MFSLEQNFCGGGEETRPAGSGAGAGVFAGQHVVPQRISAQSEDPSASGTGLCW